MIKITLKEKLFALKSILAKLSLLKIQWPVSFTPRAAIKLLFVGLLLSLVFNLGFVILGWRYINYTANRFNAAAEVINKVVEENERLKTNQVQFKKENIKNLEDLADWANSRFQAYDARLETQDKFIGENQSRLNESQAGLKKWVTDFVTADSKQTRDLVKAEFEKANKSFADYAQKVVDQVNEVKKLLNK